MTTRISLALSDRDLAYFRDAVKHARQAVRDADEDEIVDAIRDVLGEIRAKGPLPDFISGRMPDLEALIAMLGDAEWRLPAAERERLLATFVYFCDPEDLIPDDIPGIGFLDDVIMIELLIRDMRHVSAAYADFDDYRRALDAEGESRSRRLASRRRQLHARMRRRAAADTKRGRSTVLWR